MKQKGQRMDEAIHAGRSNIYPISGPKETERPEHGIGFWTRRALDVRLKTMPNTPPPPIINYTAVSVAFSFITVLILVAGLLCAAAWYMSAQSSEIQHLKEKMKETDTKAEDARKATYINKSEEDAEPTPTPAVKEKRK